MMMETSDSNHLDLEAYLLRIDYSGPLDLSQPVLEQLHLAHATHIPFENLDILLGRPISLDLAHVQGKLVAGRRGGYCFEQNLLFAAVLTKLGFSVKQLAARVRYRTTHILPRTHMLLLVTVDETTSLVDVGFGAEGLLLPVPLVANQPVQHYAWTYRLMEGKGHWVLQSSHDAAWLDLYAFTEQEQLFADYQMANYYTSTHPDSRFVQILTVQLPTPSSRKILHNREFVEDFGTTVTRRTLADDDELLDILAGSFGLYFPAGTRFQYRDTVS